MRLRMSALESRPTACANISPPERIRRRERAPEFRLQRGAQQRRRQKRNGVGGAAPAPVGRAGMGKHERRDALRSLSHQSLGDEPAEQSADDVGRPDVLSVEQRQQAAGEFAEGRHRRIVRREHMAVRLEQADLLKRELRKAKCATEQQYCVAALSGGVVAPIVAAMREPAGPVRRTERRQLLFESFALTHRRRSRL